MFGQEKKNPFEDHVSQLLQLGSVREFPGLQSGHQKSSTLNLRRIQSISTVIPYTSDPDKRLTVDYIVELIGESLVSIMGSDCTIRHVCMNVIYVEQPYNYTYCWVLHLEKNCYLPV